MEDRNLAMARRIAAEVRRAGGRTFFVGGCVRDELLGLDKKDIDIEVHGIPVPVLESILDGLGEKMTMGVGFGVWGLRHYALDIAMPRSETATGRGHRDFAVCVDPFLGPEKAARRRDFTMNALMRDVLTGELLDFFGGREDLARGILRHVDGKSFTEDPLRVFRAAQFGARFGFETAAETRALCAGMDTAALPGERVMGELEKALRKAVRPSRFFGELRAMGQLDGWFAEPAALIGVPQDPARHPEGDVWTHTMQVLDEAAALREEAEHPLWFMLAALCHDLGKAEATEEISGVLHAYGHENAGLPLAERFLGRLTGEVKLRAYVLDMTLRHMRPNAYAAGGAGEKAYMKLFDASVCPGDLLLLARADHLGRRGSAPPPDYGQTERLLRDMLRLYEERMAAPCVMGRDLIEAGLAPGRELGQALAYAHKLRLAGLSREEQLRQTLGHMRKRK